MGGFWAAHLFAASRGNHCYHKNKQQRRGEEAGNFHRKKFVYCVVNEWVVYWFNRGFGDGMAQKRLFRN